MNECHLKKKEAFQKEKDYFLIVHHVLGFQPRISAINICFLFAGNDFKFPTQGLQRLHGNITGIPPPQCQPPPPKGKQGTYMKGFV